MELAQVITTEAAICYTYSGLLPLLAVAHVFSRNPSMNRLDIQPTGPALWVAHYWESYSDPTFGSDYLWSYQDLQLPAVKSLIAKLRLTSKAVFQCGPGMALYAYG